MGTPHQMGWNENSFRGSALSAVVQSIHRSTSAAASAEPRATQRVGVLRLTGWGRGGVTPPTVATVSSRTSNMPSVAVTEMDLFSLRLSFMSG